MIALPVLAVAAALASPAPPSLSGKWILNKDASEDARAKMREAGAGRRPGGYEGPQGGMGRPGGGRMGGPGGERPPDARGGMKEFLEPPETLIITQSADEIALDDGEAVHRLRPNGQKTKADGGAVEQTARWSSAELIVESKAAKGPKIVSAYLLVPDKHQLHVTSRFEGRSGDPITVRRVYDAAPP